MGAIIAMIMLQVLSAADLRPSGFYVRGVQQGMSLSEYNAMIANGGYRSKPLGPNQYWAAIDGQDVFVSFCESKVIDVVANYKSSDWLRSIKVLEAAGFRLQLPVISTSDDEFRSGSMIFGETIPKGYTYGVLPSVRGMSVKGSELGSFQLRFIATDNPCQRNS